MTTITRTVPVLHLQVQSRYTSLMERMVNAAKRLPITHQQEVIEIIRAYSALVISQTEETADSLLTFRLNTVEFVMHEYAQGVSEKLIWMQFYNELGTLATSLLKPRTDVEAFIKANKDRLLRAKLLYKIETIMQRANDLFDRQEQLLVNGFNSTNDEFQSQFDAIRAVILELNTERKTATDDLHAEIDTLTEKVAKIYQKLEKQLNDSKAHGNDIRKQEALLSQLQDKSDNICTKAEK